MHWSATMITPALELGSAPVFRKELTLDTGHGAIENATLRISSLGVYEARLNGRPVGDDVLSPGWSAYEWRLRYREYDVASLLGEETVLTVLVGNGWYRGRLGFMGGRALYGDRLGVIAQLDVVFADGHRQVVGTDDSWAVGGSDVLADDLYDGQTVDARRRTADWYTPGAKQSWFLDVEEIEFDTTLLAPYVGPPVTRQEVVRPQRIWTSPSGRTLVDFGQNLVGWLHFTVRGPEGSEIRIRHAEVLEHDELGTRPLRDAQATDRFILSGGEDTFEPTLTFHGFRYAEVSGWPGELTKDSLEAVVVHSDLRRTGFFECSEPLLNQLHRNVVWGTKGNFLDVPTDCPQRNERLGWTGDIAAFAPSAAYLFDVNAFLSDWLVDLDLEQRAADGLVPFVIPDVLKRQPPVREFPDPDSTAVWSDAAVWVPWAMWEAYGDRSVLERQYASMTAHVRRVETKLSAEGLWDTTFQFGDWLDPDASPHEPWNAKADTGVVATACLYRTASLVAETALILGREADAEEFASLASRVRSSFDEHYVSGDGTVRSDCTTVYTLAIVFGLLDPEHEEQAGQRLADLVEKSGFTISTGFAGTPFITEALTRTGHLDHAYRLLLQTECPSWLYPVTMGATTIWERWDSMLPDGTINPGEMTSFNHYALGAVADWMHRTIGGIAPAEPGYTRVRVAPRPGGGLTSAQSALETAHGRIEVSWWFDGDGELCVDTLLPPGVSGVLDIDGRPELELPAGSSVFFTTGRRGGRRDPEPDLDELVDRLDPETKVRLLTGASMFTLHGEPSVGLEPMAFSDGPTGVRGLHFSGGPTTSLFPNATLLAAAWSEDVAREVGEILAEEAERQQVHVVLGPTINLHRTPLGGRLFEAYAEDPLLTGRLAARYVDGLQSRGIGACLKHLVANEAETDRHTVNSVVDERTLRELYLLPFEIAVADAHPWSVMAAYNDVNGVPATEQDDVNNAILKGEWGWDGLLMSDWFATRSAAPAANGGLDLVMPGPDGPWGRALLDAVESGEVPEDVLDDHVRRLLRLAGRVGALGEPRTWRGPMPEPTDPVRREQLTRLAVSGMTVLRNDGAVLPLAGGSRVALIGRHAVETVCMGGGSASVRAPHQVSVADGLRSRLGDDLMVEHGVEVRLRPRAARMSALTDPVSGEPGMRVRVHGASGALLSDYRSETGLVVLVGEDDDLPEPPARVALAAVLPAGHQRIGVVGVGDWTVAWAEETVTPSLTLTTDDVGEAILRPPGWQREVVVAEGTEIRAEVGLDVRGGVGLVCEPTPAPDDDAIGAAVAAAREADVAVVVVGLTEEQETEAVDKTTLALPGRQDDLVRAVAAAARRTVVVANAATPVLMPWRDDVDAVLWVGIPGQEGGDAVAAALLGELEPSGRLVTSFPAADGASPAWEVVPTDGVLAYDEGAYVGYRGFAAGRAAEPAYWFGEGLGYGAWSYGHASVSGRTVTVEVTNTSTRNSREVVQVYYDPQGDEQPVRLAGWTAVDVPAGATATVEVICDERMWRTWDVDAGGWRLLQGGQLVVARGLGDVRHRLACP